MGYDKTSIVTVVGVLQVRDILSESDDGGLFGKGSSGSCCHRHDGDSLALVKVFVNPNGF